MLDPAKAIASAALVLGLSVAFLVAQPFDRLGGSVAGAEEAAEPVAPVEVTARHLGILGCKDAESSEVDGNVVRTYGVTCEILNEWSDPRLKGTETYHGNSNDYADSSGLSIGHYVHNIVTDDGAWRMRPLFRIDSYAAGPESFSGTWVLDGEGAYEGLSAVLAKREEGDLAGFIVESDLLPPPPEEDSAN